MEPGRPSLTAAWVAALRGVAGVSDPPIVEDPLAADLVPRLYGRAIRLVHRFPRAWQRLHGPLDVASGGHLDHIAFRTRAIDEAIDGRVALGARQLVLLGAGLDARAWRLASLRDATVFEVDYPSTQAYKKKRIGSRPPLAHRVEFVSVDFQRDVLSERLRAAGHDPQAPSVFVWEGVTMYLSPADVDRTLRDVATLASVGSALLVTYLHRGVTGFTTTALNWLVRAASEPFGAKYTEQEIARSVEAHGFRVIADEGDLEWAARFQRRRAAPAIERLLLAQKDATERR